MNEGNFVSREYVTQLQNNMESVMVGKTKVIRFLLTSLLAGGHVLMEDVPGTGKTMMAKTLAKSLEGVFSRIQFTPDLLPSDVTGLHYYNQKLGEFVLKKGPVFGNILLADEINRATPRTQSSLLECMEERQVTIDGETMTLPKPFLVIATQNPVETAGTFPLPEAQLDRFLMKLSMGLPELEEETEILNRYVEGILTEDRKIPKVCTCEDLITMQNEVAEVYVHPSLRTYIANLSTQSRLQNNIRLGISPRGTIAMLRAARAFAYIKGRTFVIPEDIQELAQPVFAHRLVIASGYTGEQDKKKALESILQNTEVPTEEWQGM